MGRPGVEMTTRCPKCAKINYGETAKCSFCGSSLKFTPGEEIPEVKEEDVKEKIKTIKAKRLRNPMQIGIGGVVMVVGLMTALILFLSCMFLFFSPSSISPSYDSGAWHYTVPGGTETVYGKITAKVYVANSKWPQGSNHGYSNHTAYELSGNGADKRWEALSDESISLEDDCWVYSTQDLGGVGDTVLVKVEGKKNSFGETRAVVVDKKGNGLLSGWLFLVPGLLIMIGGGILLALGIIGKADRSLERLLEEDKEFRKQQLAMMQAARKAAIEKQKQSTWAPEHYPQTQQSAYPSQAPLVSEPISAPAVAEGPIAPPVDAPAQAPAASPSFTPPQDVYIPPEQAAVQAPAVNTVNNP